MNHYLTPLGNSQVHRDDVLADANQGTPRFEAALGKPFHSGMTRAERIAAGFGTPTDHSTAVEQRRLHIEWKNSATGKAFAIELKSRQ